MAHKSFCVYGTLEALDGCKILLLGVGTIYPLAETVLENVCLVKHVQAIFVVWSENGFRKNDHMFTCVGKSPLPK